MTANEPHARIGEIVEASTTEFTAQCYRLYDAPTIGSLVLCSEQTPVYGVVCEATTQSIDPGRAAVPRGLDAASEAEIFSNNPQIERLLFTKFRAVIVGYQDGDFIRRYPPLNAPHLYSFVRKCDRDEVGEFSSSHEFLNILLNEPIDSQDHVIASFLRYASTAHADSRQYLLDACKSLASALAGQLPRLSGIVRGLE